MSIYAIDPGYERSALVVLEGGAIDANLWPNDELCVALGYSDIPAGAHLVIEQVASYGMPVGKEVFETVFWSGRFAQAWQTRGVRYIWSRLPRSAVKMALCHSMKANDATIRQALIDMYGPGKEKAIGTKKAPGPLYGIKADLWAALALGLTYRQQIGRAA